MKAGVYRVPGRHHEDHLTAMAEGLERHGVNVEFFSSVPPENIDIAVVWSWRVALNVRQYFGGPVLVMERGYIGDRFHWTSLGWNGLNGRAKFTTVDVPARFDTLFGDLLKPWNYDRGYALIVGQVLGDAALADVDIHRWYRDVGVEMFKRGWEVKFRQHPVEVERGVPPPHVSFATRLEGSLDDALAGAGIVVTYNSNTAVNAVLAGKPVHATDVGSIVYEITSHDFSPFWPERESCLRRLAWRQFSPDELRSGFAWEIARESVPA